MRRTGRRLRQEYPTTVQIKLANTTAITSSYFFLCYVITLSVKLLTSYWKAGLYFRCSLRLHIDIDRTAHPDIFFKYTAEGLWRKWSWTVSPLHRVPNFRVCDKLPLSCKSKWPGD